MIQDGYGDMVPDEEFVARWTAHANTSARTLVGDADPRFDDVRQEALIEAWREASNHPGYSATWIAKASRMRALEVASTSRPMFGHPDTKPGPKSRPTTYAVDWTDQDGPIAEPVEDSDPLAAVEWGYHHGLLRQAMESLKPEDREYVFRRFWLGQGDVEIAKVIGIDRVRLNSNWRRRIKPRLAEALELLAS